MESMTSLVDLGMSSFDASVSGVGSRSHQMFHQIATSKQLSAPCSRPHIDFGEQRLLVALAGGLPLV
jgi:hypothetical protein